MKVIAFTSVKLQHMLMSRPEFKSVTDLAGKRIGASGFGNLPAYEIQILIDRYRLGSNTTIVPVASSMDRLIAMQRGTIDAAIVAAPLDIKAEEMGLKRLMHMGTILQIPQAGLTATEEKLKKNRREVVEVMKATIEGLDYTWAQHNNVVEIIAKWVQLSQPQAAKAYDSVKDTFSRNGIPTDEQSKAYIAMLTATANLGAEPAGLKAEGADARADEYVRHRIAIADGQHCAPIPLIEQPHRGRRRLYPQHRTSLHGG